MEKRSTFRENSHNADRTRPLCRREDDLGDDSGRNKASTTDFSPGKGVRSACGTGAKLTDVGR